MPVAYLSLGSNLGDREKNVHTALAELAAYGTITAISALHETAPVGIINQPLFLNAVAAFTTKLEPHQLLEAIHKIEAGLGRTRIVRFGPRTIDIDILFYDDLILNEPSLTLPHPHLHERSFVLTPLAEIAPHHIHPILKKSIHELVTTK